MCSREITVASRQGREGEKRERETERRRGGGGGWKAGVGGRIKTDQYPEHKERVFQF